jgi:3',5'-cyclic AMP phosphodiesterase CpdA
MLQRLSVGRSSLAAIAVAPVLAFWPSAESTRFVAIGDFGVGGATERSMGASVKSWTKNHPIDLLLTLGDNDYTESPSAFHDNWVASFGWLETAGTSVAGTLGNHDVRVDGGRYEFDELGMPRARYRRRIGDVGFFFLNSNAVGSAKQKEWLRRALADSTARWQIVAFHHPAYTCGGYYGNGGVLSRWVPLLERYGADLVLSGHDHNYQRFKEHRGVRYVVHGGGGAPLYSIRSCPGSYPARRVARAVRGFLYLVAEADRLRGFAVKPSGAVLDTFTVRP